MKTALGVASYNFFLIRVSVYRFESAHHDMPENQSKQLPDDPPPKEAASGPQHPSPKEAIVGPVEKVILYLFLGGFLVAMFIFLASELSTQESNFRQGAALAKDTFDKVASTPDRMAYRPDVALLYTFQFSRALEAAHTKMAAIILGTLIVCLGCIVVVYGVEASYQLTVNPNTINPSSLTTSSPGLVLITLGVLVIVVAQFTHSTFDTSVDWVVPNTQPTAAKSSVSSEGPNAEQYPTPVNSKSESIK